MGGLKKNMFFLSFLLLSYPSLIYPTSLSFTVLTPLIFLAYPYAHSLYDRLSFFTHPNLNLNSLPLSYPLDHTSRSCKLTMIIYNFNIHPMPLSVQTAQNLPSLHPFKQSWSVCQKKHSTKNKRPINRTRNAILHK